MRICLLSREYPPETGWGGIGTFTHHLANALRDLGKDVHVVALTGQEKEKPSTKTVEGITIHRVPPETIRDRTSFFNFSMPVTRPMLQQNAALWNKFLELHQMQPFDVLECAEHFAEGLFPAMAHVAPMVVRLHTPHSKLVNERYHNFQPNLDHRVLTMLERLPMLCADVLVSPSEDLARYVANDLNLALDRIHIVPNPVDETRFTPDGPRAIPAGDNINIVFCGRLEERKGVYYLIEAAAKLVAAVPSARITLIGRDTNTAKHHGSVKAELQARAQALGIEQSVNFVDQVDLDQLPAYYRSADIFVLPSLYENGPMVAIEAMSCGRPVVGTSGGGTKEYVKDGECGLIVPPADSESLADALIKLANDKQLREKMGEQGRQRVLSEYTRKVLAERTLALYTRARERFLQREQPAGIYSNDPQKLYGDLRTLIDSYEQTLYNMMYTKSWRFRLRHWTHKRLKNRLFG